MAKIFHHLRRWTILIGIRDGYLKFNRSIGFDFRCNFLYFPRWYTVYIIFNIFKTYNLTFQTASHYKNYKVDLQKSLQALLLLYLSKKENTTNGQIADYLGHRHNFRNYENNYGLSECWVGLRYNPSWFMSCDSLRKHYNNLSLPILVDTIVAFPRRKIKPRLKVMFIPDWTLLH